METFPIKKRIVVIGGGTGTYTALSGLKHLTDKVELSAVVTMADSGGSTGRLRDEFGYLPVGDVRMALVALADDAYVHDRRLRELFLYRFDKGGPSLAGHNFGNLLLVALTEVTGSEKEAIRTVSRMLHTKGMVYPVTTDHLDLVATYDDGVVVRGEAQIDEPVPGRFDHRITSIVTDPVGRVDSDAERAILEADLVVLGPGDLFTSVLAVCAVGGVREALQKSRAHIVWVANLMTKRGQTHGMSIDDHANEIERAIGRSLTSILCNQTPLPEDLLDRYKAEGEYPVARCEGEYVLCDMLSVTPISKVKGDALRRSLIRHDPDKLARALLSLI